MSLEFELPLISLIFIIILKVVYFSKAKVRLVENKYFEIILLCSGLEMIIDTILHFICSITPYEDLVANYMEVFTSCNRILSTLFVAVFASLLCYILTISYEKVKKHNDILCAGLVAFVVLFSVATLFTNVKLVRVGSITNVTGSTTMLCYIAVAFVLFLSVVFTALKFKKLDNRYASLFAILIFVIFFYEIIAYFPGMLIYSTVLALMCYVMYFTIENPDLKALKDVELARKEAEKANRAKTDFLSNMSHEIRTPLNAIVGFSECILKENSMDTAKEDAKDIIMASHNLLEIVNGILDISKIEAGKMELVEADYSLKEMGNDLVKLLSSRIGEKPIELRHSFAVDIPNVLYGDGGKVRQVITNILTNAIKYTEKGYIDFNIGCVNQNNLSKIVISIEDTGRGIREDKIQKLFTKFERLDEDKNTTLEGTGLGLAITKSLVEMMGGKIVVQSKYGEGTKFTIYLVQKISENQTIENTNESEDLKKDFSGKNILVVDDNKLNLKIASRLIGEYNVSIDQVESGFSCIDKINAGNKYDLILMDDMMPKLSGVETLSKLKEISGFNIPVVILTANAIDGMKEKYIEDGFNDYLSKPIDRGELKRILNNYLKDVSCIKEETPISNDIETPSESNVKSKQFLIDNGIDVDAGLELLGDIDMYNETLNSFINETIERLPKMEQFINESNMKDYAILAHAMKSDSKYLGFKDLINMSLDHELKGKANDYEYVKNNYQSLKDEVNRVIDIVKKYLG